MGAARAGPWLQGTRALPARLRCGSDATRHGDALRAPQAATRAAAGSGRWPSVRRAFELVVVGAAPAGALRGEPVLDLARAQVRRPRQRDRVLLVVVGDVGIVAARRVERRPAARLQAAAVDQAPEASGLSGAVVVAAVAVIVAIFVALVGD